MSALETVALPATTITRKIVSIIFYTFIAFLCVGLPIAVLPGYVHEQLGFSPVVAGITIGLQYFATLVSRPMAGRVADSLGGKRCNYLRPARHCPERPGDGGLDTAGQACPCSAWRYC